MSILFDYMVAFNTRFSRTLLSYFGMYAVLRFLGNKENKRSNIYWDKIKGRNRVISCLVIFFIC